MFILRKKFTSIRYGVTASTVRSHRADRGSTPRIGVSFFGFQTICKVRIISVHGQNSSFTTITRDGRSVLFTSSIFLVGVVPDYP